MGVLAMASQQLLLFDTEERKDEGADEHHAALRIAGFLSERCGKPVSVVLTDNSSTMISVRRQPDLRVRLHRMFANAPQEVTKALAVYVKWPGHGKSNETLTQFIKTNSRLIKPSPPGRIEIVPCGKHFDLEAIYDKLNHEHFDGKVTTPITWGRPYMGKRRRSISFGSYDAQGDLIRINSALDAPFVPGFFVEYIVYHEMLHSLVGERVAPDGRRALHHGQFRRRERAYPRYDDAAKWEKENLHRFLGRRR